MALITNAISIIPNVRSQSLSMVRFHLIDKENGLTKLMAVVII